MFFLRTEDGTLHRFADSRALPKGEHYAILSHVWAKTGEQTFQELEALIMSGAGLAKASMKIREFCRFAKGEGYRWVWIDSCCIDKTSSAELSEAINAMYAWYADAHVCYAYLADVPDDEDPCMRHSRFRRSKWFTRGWTLQELIAPRSLIFLSQRWTIIGTKAGLADTIEEVTGVDRDVLTLKRALHDVSVARRMSWAADRETTRLEDEAYSLMGIFGVYMPTIYGEGSNAFVRLQEEILRHIPDQSLFVWGLDRIGDGDSLKEKPGNPLLLLRGPRRTQSLFAQRPRDFRHSARVRTISYQILKDRLGVADIALPGYALTSHGVSAQLPVAAIPNDGPSSEDDSKYLAFLACEDTDDGLLLALVLQPSPGTNKHQYHVASPRVTRIDPAMLHTTHDETIGQQLRGFLYRMLGWEASPSVQALSQPEVTHVYINSDNKAVRRACDVLERKMRAMYSASSQWRPSPTPFFMPLRVVFPPWVAARLRESGLSVHCAHVGRELLFGRVRRGAQRYSIVLRDGQGGAIQLWLDVCPLSGALRVFVSFGGPQTEDSTQVQLQQSLPDGCTQDTCHGDSNAGTDVQEQNADYHTPDCKEAQVHCWEEGEKEFRQADRVVRVSFAPWGSNDGDESQGRMYCWNVVATSTTT
ncbi:heterokaryon incompatibility protein-domain-containing protein [Cubamyces lactineus]|nr:heterokaryon incompatibility protein-domain-containing protein [Cubamyces lactineus]